MLINANILNMHVNFFYTALVVSFRALIVVDSRDSLWPWQWWRRGKSEAWMSV